MTVPPLPDVPCVRVLVSGEDGALNEWGTRFYLSYSGSAPSGANCNTLAADIGSAWGTNFNGLISNVMLQNRVDVIDIATHSGASGTDTTVHAGTRAGNLLPIQVAFNCEYGIARRYRGGKPRGYFPFGVDGDLLSQAEWVHATADGFATDIGNFFTAVEALSVGSMGTLKHVNQSFYQGFANHTNTSGRTRAVPTYRSPNATHDNIVSYIAKYELSSQRRRRKATTP